MDNTLVHNPDVLECLANLSNDEVFTPPKVVNDMLDMLPQELFTSTTTTFLDPCCKSGIFLREIAKRLIAGTRDQFSDLQSCVDHIFHKQLFGIAITELTALMSRRSLYCSKDPSCIYSASKFESVAGNIRFKTIQHAWNKGKCRFCGASQSEYDRGDNKESHAYEFIHCANMRDLQNELLETEYPNTDQEKTMHFDVIIGNPPYQMSDGGNKNSATPIYQNFVNASEKLQPIYIIMVIPSRWYCGGRGLEEFRKQMLSECHLKELHDFKKSSDCFPGIRNGGGICYFLWDKLYISNNCRFCEHNSDGIISNSIRPLNEFGEIFIRSTKACEIIRKINSKNEKKLSDLVFSQKPFGFRTNFIDFDKDGDIKIYNKKSKNGYDFIKRQRIEINSNLVDNWKVVTSRSTSVPEEDNGQVLRMSQTFIVEPGAIVTESYVMIGVFENQTFANNLYSYIKTKFVRFLCQPTIVSPDVSKRTFIFVPLQDFSKPWTDAELYAKYGLSEEEIEFIESMIKPME